MVARPQILPLRDLLDGAPQWNKRLVQTMRPSPEAGTDAEVLRQTREDRALRSCVGPFRLDTLNQWWGPDGWVALARNGLWQSHNGKLRCIDNGRTSSSNLATTEGEQLRVITGDIVAGQARWFLRHVPPDLRPHFQLVGYSEDWKRGYRQRAFSRRI